MMVEIAFRGTLLLGATFCGAAAGVIPGLLVSAWIGTNLSEGVFWGTLCGMLLGAALALYQCITDWP